MCMLCGPVPKVSRGYQGATETGWVPERTGFLSLPTFARPSGAGTEAAVMAVGLFSDPPAQVARCVRSLSTQMEEWVAGPRVGIPPEPPAPPPQNKTPLTCVSGLVPSLSQQPGHCCGSGLRGLEVQAQRAVTLGKGRTWQASPCRSWASCVFTRSPVGQPLQEWSRTGDAPALGPSACDRVL